MKKQRVDQLLVDRGLAPNRTRARALLLSGRVFRNEQRVDKAGTQLPVDAPLTVRGVDKYVSRGGEKLEGALRELGLDPAGLTCVDVGASTGGFTDCLLQHGASFVIAVDVGHGQLAEKLRRDERVENRERTNARDLAASDIAHPVDLVVVDASFIGMGKLLPAIARTLPEGGRLLAMIKPQFEVGKQAAAKARGVIRDPEVRAAAIAKVRGEIEQAGFRIEGGCDSAVHGPKGNVEHFVLAVRAGAKRDPA